MTFGFKQLPAGVELSPTARRVFEVLASHTSFPWPVMQAQCNRFGLDASKLLARDLPMVLEHLAAAVGRFTSPETGKCVEADLRALL